MAIDSDSSHGKLTHFHACVHCGNLCRREEFDGTSIATGIYTCPKCGLEGPLNIVIQDVEDAATGAGHASSNNSAG